MSVLIRLDLVLGWCLSGHVFYEAGKRSNGNGNRPSEKPFGASEQYIEYQKATIELIQKVVGREGKGREGKAAGARSRPLGDFAAGSIRSETWQGNVSSFWTDDGVKRNVIKGCYKV